VIAVSAKTFTEQTRTDARRLFDEGYGCNAIARELGFSPARISKWAKDEGLLFDRRQTELAVRAHTIDLAADRLLLAQKMIVNANDSLEMLEGPFEVFNFGGKENDFNSQILDEAPMEARRSAQMIAGVAFDKATRIVEKDNGGLDDAVGVIDDLSAVFKAAADAIRAADETPTETVPDGS
jgi:nucleoid-associated protein YgaU